MRTETRCEEPNDRELVWFVRRASVQCMRTIGDTDLVRKRSIKGKTEGVRETTERFTVEESHRKGLEIWTLIGG